MRYVPSSLLSTALSISNLLTKRWVRRCRDSITGISYNIQTRINIITNKDLSIRIRDLERETTAILGLPIHKSNRDVCTGWQINLERSTTSNVVRLVVKSLGVSIARCPSSICLCTKPEIHGVVGIRDVKLVSTGLAGIEVTMVVQSKVVQGDVAS
jgi:hypothetical protein